MSKKKVETYECTFNLGENRFIAALKTIRDGKMHVFWTVPADKKRKEYLEIKGIKIS